MVLIKIALIIVLTVVLLKSIVRSLIPWLIKKNFVDKKNPFFSDFADDDSSKKESKYDGKGEYVEYEEIKEEDKKKEN